MSNLTRHPIQLATLHLSDNYGNVKRNCSLYVVTMCSHRTLCKKPTRNHSCMCLPHMRCTLGRFPRIHARTDSLKVHNINTCKYCRRNHNILLVVAVVVAVVVVVLVLVVVLAVVVVVVVVVVVLVLQ
jgi:hypothetical protein